jgi:hypothetical protein
MKFTNTQLWLMVGATLAVYLILVLEDIADGLSKNRYVVLNVLNGTTDDCLDHKDIVPVKRSPDKETKA